MADSDEDNEREYESEMNLAGFMFGNIDENGQLEDDILDSNAKEHLSSLYHLGLGSLLQEMIAQDAVEKKELKDPDANIKKEPEENLPLENGEIEKDVKEEYDVDYVVKDPNALDFSDINELAEDCIDEVGGEFVNEKLIKQVFFFEYNH